MQSEPFNLTFLRGGDTEALGRVVYLDPINILLSEH
jgi:hypothetical protein